MNLIERIDHWAAVAPEATAHISDGRTLTFGELQSRSDALACYLTQHLGNDRLDRIGDARLQRAAPGPVQRRLDPHFSHGAASIVSFKQMPVQSINITG